MSKQNRGRQRTSSMASWFNAVSQALKEGDVAGALETTKGSLQNAAKNVTTAVDENIKKVRTIGSTLASASASASASGRRRARARPAGAAAASFGRTNMRCGGAAPL